MNKQELTERMTKATLDLGIARNRVYNAVSSEETERRVYEEHVNAHIMFDEGYAACTNEKTRKAHLEIALVEPRRLLEMAENNTRRAQHELAKALDTWTHTKYLVKIWSEVTE